MADPREDFEYECAKNSNFTESTMKYSRDKHGGYRSIELDLMYKGWRLARTQEVRSALRRNSEGSEKI